MQSYYFLFLGRIWNAIFNRDSGTEHFERGVEAVKSIAESWDAVWQRTLDAGGNEITDFGSKIIYTQLCEVGAVFAVGCLVFLAIRQFKLFVEQNYQQYFMGIFFPFLVTILLSNNGLVLREISFELRTYINTVNTSILESAVEGANLQETYLEYKKRVGRGFIMPQLTAQCQSLADETSQAACLAYAQLQALRLEENGNAETEEGGQGGASVYETNPWSVLGASEEGDVVTSNEVMDSYWNDQFIPYYAPMGEAKLFQMLNAFQSGYQQMTEGALILTALLGPLAVGGGLLLVGENLGNNMLFAWFTGFFSIGWTKICFNLVVGFAAVANVNASSSDPLPLATIAGVYAPILSAGLAGLGGMAVWQSISSAASGTAETALKVANKGIPGF